MDGYMSMPVQKICCVTEEELHSINFMALELERKDGQVYVLLVQYGPSSSLFSIVVYCACFLFLMKTLSCIVTSSLFTIVAYLFCPFVSDDNTKCFLYNNLFDNINLPVSVVLLHA